MKLSTMATKGTTQTHSALYRKTGGKLGGRFRGSPTLLLATTGRRSPEPLRVAPEYWATAEVLMEVRPAPGDVARPDGS